MNRVYIQDEVVTIKFDNAVSSNTYLVAADLGSEVLLYHPLFPSCLLKYSKSEVDNVSPNVKDSTERSLDFIRKNSNYLDYNAQADHEALCMYFVVKRKLTPRQKNLMSNMAGTIASIKLNNDVKAAMELVKNNAAILDEFNSMWYRNFGRLFSGRQLITSKKQRAAIFNIAGFVMAELERPMATNGYNE